MSETNDMRREFEAWYYEIENVSMRCERLHDLSIRRDAFFAAWQAATERATAIAQTAMTDEKITQLWGDLQARNIKEKRERYKDQIGALCGACHIGKFFLNSNGYNDFPECAKCRHVPLLLDGIDMSAAAKKMREAIKPEQA